MKQMSFFIATSTEIPKKGMKDYLCRKLTTNPGVMINCFMGRINFTFKLWSSDSVYVVVDGEGDIYFVQLQKK